MSMTAAELYEIVKDVPREAWPEQFDWYEETGESPYRCFTVNGEEYNYKNNLLELAFIGSMTAWLCGRNIEIKRQSHENSQLRYTVTACNGWEDVVSVHVELVAALAAACKEAA